VIISHKYRFIFIKTYKTAGTSIEVFLSGPCDAGDVFTPITPPVAPHVPRNHEGFQAHMPAREVQAKVPEEVWKGYFKFCVERNPWDKTLSHYHMMNHRAGGGLSFDAYLANGDLPVSYPLYTHPAGSEILVDQVLRYETLTEGLAEVFGSLGVPFDGSLNIRAKAEYRSDRRPYREVYTEAQRRCVEQAFEWEIRTHGYRF
jgi:hypothetical protein